LRSASYWGPSMTYDELFRSLLHPSYRVAPIARSFGVSIDSVYREIKRGHLVGTKICGSTRVTRANLARYLVDRNFEIDLTDLHGEAR